MIVAMMEGTEVVQQNGKAAVIEIPEFTLEWDAGNIVNIDDAASVSHWWDELTERGFTFTNKNWLQVMDNNNESN